MHRCEVCNSWCFCEDGTPSDDVIVLAPDGCECCDPPNDYCPDCDPDRAHDDEIGEEDHV